MSITMLVLVFSHNALVAFLCEMFPETMFL